MYDRVEEQRLLRSDPSNLPVDQSMSASSFSSRKIPATDKYAHITVYLYVLSLNIDQCKIIPSDMWPSDEQRFSSRH